MMEKKENLTAKTAVQTKNEEYLAKLFSLLRQRENIVISDKKGHFNNTELRLINEVLSAKYENRRLISTQIAKRLGITRSAVSQIVNRLEERNVVKRVPDDVDRKIAYVEISEGVLDIYGEDMENVLAFVGNLVNEFGEEKYNCMCELFESFITLAQKKIQEVKQKN